MELFFASAFRILHMNNNYPAADFTSEHLNQNLKITDMHKGTKILPLKVWLDCHAKYKSFDRRPWDMDYKDNDIVNGNIYENLVCELRMLVRIVNQCKHGRLSENSALRLNNLNEIETIIYNKQREIVSLELAAEQKEAAAVTEKGVLNLIIIIIVISVIVILNRPSSSNYTEPQETPNYRR